ncbi:MAG: capsular polysaccharide biosynthesis protein [Eubacteriales bacterium]|nr:capsular polysaccharide biosynthesis protein [Eubacteriales bacterium]
MPRANIITEKATRLPTDNNMVIDNMNVDENVSELDLVELLFHLLGKIRYILLIAVVGALLAAGYTIFIIKPIYEATAKLYVLNSSDSALNLSDLQIGSYLASDYIEVFKTWEVNESVVSDLGLDYTYKQMQKMLTIENPTGTRILYITVRSRSPQEAASIANDYATVAIKYIASTMATDEPNILSVALVPTNPASPNKTVNIMLGFMLGLLFSIGWFTIRFVMDDKIKSVDDIRKYSNLPILAVVPTYGSAPAEKKQIGKARKKS